MDEEEYFSIGEKLESQGLSHSQIDEFFEHQGVKGMKWGVRRGNQGRAGDVHGLTRKSTSTQSRGARNGKRIAAGLIGGPAGLVAYNTIAAPLTKGASSKMKTQSRAARNGKLVVATLLTGGLGGVAYYQMGKKVAPKTSKK